MAIIPPSSYNTWRLPDLAFSHHPASSLTVTPVVLVILNRPKAKNSFTDAMTASLVTAFNTLSVDPRVRCVVLTGSDPSNRFFCAGMDLNPKTDHFERRESEKPGEPDAAQIASTRAAHRDGGGKVALAIFNCAKPVVAALNGSAVGVGITCTLPASIRIAAKGSKVGFVFARRGFNMEATSSFFLPRLIGTAKAMHLVTTGGVYTPESHLLRDLFSEVVEPDRVLPRALEIAEEVTANTSAVSTAVNKMLIYRGLPSPEETHLLDSALFWDLFRSGDATEGMKSFLEKRPPRFMDDVDKNAPAMWGWWKKGSTKEAISKL